MATEPSLAALPVDERRDFFYWRFLVTGFSFLLFPIGAVVVGVVLLPLVRLFPASAERRRARARAIMRGGLRLFIAIMSGLGGMTYEFRGVERLGRPGQMIVANHPSLIDVVFLLGFSPAPGCVVKAGLWRNPLTYWAVTLAEYIRNDSPATMIEAAARSLREGQHLIMFPEGTRTVPNAPFVFHRGAANIAVRAAKVVTPVYIRCEPTTLTKSERWYRIPARRPRFTLIVGDDLDPQAYRNRPAPVASRQFNDFLQAHFQERLRTLMKTTSDRI